MKTLKKSILLLASLVVAVSAASCINDELTEPQKETAVKELATVDEQAASMEATLADLEALLTSAEGLDEELASVVSSIENHIADLKAGATLLDGTLATLERQKELAEVMAAIEFGAEATKGGAALTKAVASVDKRAESWLGKHFAAYYPAAKAEASAAARLASLDLKTQKISVEAILSDVEAGLRKDADKEELTALAAKIDSNADEVAELLATLTETRTEVETEYAETVETAVTDPSGFDLPALKQFNSAVAGTLAEADNSLAGLIARVEECEAQLEDIRTRLGALENTVTDLNELLGLIQSVTFMSEFSAENAIAYYNLGTESRDDGKKVRNPQGTIDLRYIIRPASAAQALTVTDLWDDEVKVFGYYAQAITKSALETFDFDITNVTADEAGNGIVTVTVSAASLGESFYFKETGAKLALSIATGKTDLTSKFVEIVPKDASGKVYVESVELSAKSLEIDNGQTADIDAYITPGNATEGGVIWTTSNADVLTVTENGVIEGKSVGSAVITATTKGTDEWGNTIQAQCNVTVNTNIRLNGPSYVEETKETTILLESPNFIDSEYVKWEIGTFTSKNAAGEPTGFNTNQSYASIDETGKVSGLLMYYNTSDNAKEYVPLMVKCTIEGGTPIILYHEIRVVALQPLGISINLMSDTDTQISTKQGQALELYATLKPQGINTELFKLNYSMNCPDGYFGASTVGTHAITMSVSADQTGKYNYFYPKGKTLARNITVVVNPYYVQTVTLPETFEMNLDQTATLPVTLTSDIEGKDPTYPDLIWTSSASEIVSINETTGEMTSLKEGSVTITATTSHANAVPTGQAQKSASCVVTVKKPTAAIAIGDYYYSDGTWSTERDYSKTVIGIVFAKVNAAVSDVQMINDHPECYNGLVVSTAEYLTPMQENGASWSRNTYFNWMNSNGYTQAQDTEKYSGYGTTKGMVEINSANVSDDYGTVYFDLCEPLIQHRNSVEAPEISSGWYLPSYPEMKLLYDNFDAVNASIQSVGGTVMTKTYTFTDTVNTPVKDYTKDNQYYCTYVNNGSNWTAFNMNTSNMVTTGRYINDAWSSTGMPKAEWPVRIILAF